MAMRIKAALRGKKVDPKNRGAFTRDLSRTVAKVLYRLGKSKEPRPGLPRDEKFCRTLVEELYPRIDWQIVAKRLETP